MIKSINVTVWNETDGSLGPYPDGIHNAIAGFLRQSGVFGTVRTATQPQPEHGLTDDVLNDTDVLVWWGHCYHHLVSDEVVGRVWDRVQQGMGFIALHSAHASKIFLRLMGTQTNRLRWRDIGELERVWIIDRHHPIMHGIPEYIEVPKSEMYGEYFHIPAPDELLAISWYEGGEVFRSACTFKRGGKVFFFSPGHETYPIYDMPDIQRIIVNAAQWAAPDAYPVVTTDYTPETPNDIYRKN